MFDVVRNTEDLVQLSIVLTQVYLVKTSGKELYKNGGNKCKLYESVCVVKRTGLYGKIY